MINLVIAETSSENERSTRFVRLSGMTTALGALLSFAIGYYIQWRGFTDLFWIALAVEVLSIVAVIIFYQPTPHPSSSSVDERRSPLSTPDEQTDSTRSQCGIVSSVFSCQDARSRTRSLNVTLILLAYTFYYIPPPPHNTHYRETRFPLVPDRPMWSQGRRVSDSNFPWSSTHAHALHGVFK